MSDEFRIYKHDPTSDNLIRLLRAHQDRVYRLCFQVLRREHDAQDAAQEVLMRLADGARGIADSDAFRRWVWRVSLNAALEIARKSARRRVHESRAAMNPPAAAPLDDESRRALFEAIARLEDGPRSLLLDHYFEGETLESLGSREGVSSQAVSKRLERAREDLRRAIPALGAALPDLGGLFEARGAGIPDLVSGPVLAKVAAVAGGIAMTSKSMILPIAVAVALFLSLGVGIVAMSIRLPQSAGRANQPSGPMSHADAGAGTTVAHDLPKQLSAAEDRDSEAGADPVRLSPLRAKLDRFKRWWGDIQEDRTLGRADGEKWGAFQKRWDRELWDHVSGLKELILKDPEGFLRFLRDPDNESVLADLVSWGLLTQTDRPHVGYMAPFKDFPTELTNGLFELLKHGTIAQRSASLRLLGELPDTPDHYKDVYIAMLDDPNFQQQAIGLVAWQVPMTPTIFAKLTALGAHENLYVRLRVASSMAFVKGPEAEAFVLNRLAVADHQNEIFQITYSLESKYRGARQEGRPILEDHLARSIVEAMGRNSSFYLDRLLPVAAFLPAERLKPILQQAMAKTEYDWYRERIAKVIERIGQGPYTPEDLTKILDPR